MAAALSWGTYEARAAQVPVTHYSCPNDFSNIGRYVPPGRYWGQDFRAQGEFITGGELALGADLDGGNHDALIGIYSGPGRAGALAEVTAPVRGYASVPFSFPTPLRVSPGQPLWIAATGIGNFTAYDSRGGCFIGRINGFNEVPAPTAPAGAPPTPAGTVAGAGPATPGVVHQYRVYHTCANGACGLRVRAGPGFSHYPVVRVLLDGDPVGVVCQTTGEAVSGLDGSSSTIWNRLTDGQYVPDYYIDTPGFGAPTPGIASCSDQQQPQAASAASPGYSVTSSNGLRLRRAPFADAPYDGVLPFGATVEVECQAPGQRFGGSAVWDRVWGDFWLPDAFLSTPGRDGAYSEGIARCDGNSGGDPQVNPPSALTIQTGPAETCKRDVVFIGARGSGEGSVGFGPTVYAVFGPVRRAIPDERLVRDGLDHSYPAMDVKDILPNLLWGGFKKSVDAGVTAILVDMGYHISRLRSAGCPNPPRFLLAGFSQGAWAVGDAFLTMSDKYRELVAGVVLIGDPRNRGNLLMHGIYDNGHPWPVGISGNVWNSCRPRDGVCSADAVSGPARALSCIQKLVRCSHSRYADPGAEAQQAGEWLARRITG